jgi:hypothetical protein
MAKTKQEIISDIEKHFNGIEYRDCYIGITSDIEERLYKDHNVSKDSGHWIYRTANSNNTAREIEEYFIKNRMDGGGSGGNENTKIVYAYKKTAYTKQ